MYVCIICSMQWELFVQFKSSCGLSESWLGWALEESGRADRQTDKQTDSRTDECRNQADEQTDGQTDRQTDRPQSKVKQGGRAGFWFFFRTPCNVYRVSVCGSESLVISLLHSFLFTLGFLFVCESLVQLAKALNYIIPSLDLPHLYIISYTYVCI